MKYIFVLNSIYLNCKPRRIQDYIPKVEYFIHLAGLSLVKILFILGIVAFYTIAERKIMGAIQRRKGPNVVGILGMLQPLADGFKLIIKEVLVPTHALFIIYLITPMIMLLLS